MRPKHSVQSTWDKKKQLSDQQLTEIKPEGVQKQVKVLDGAPHRQIDLSQRLVGQLLVPRLYAIIAWQQTFRQQRSNTSRLDLPCRHLLKSINGRSTSRRTSTWLILFAEFMSSFGTPSRIVVKVLRNRTQRHRKAQKLTATPKYCSTRQQITLFLSTSICPREAAVAHTGLYTAILLFRLPGTSVYTQLAPSTLAARRQMYIDSQPIVPK